MPGRYYSELNNIHVNCEAPRAYFIPFETAQNADKAREQSKFFTSLNGEWDFAFFKNIEELEIESEDFTKTVKPTDKMPVPFCWQLKTDCGYDVPNYINQDYPYPVDPPYLPDEIPCGFYSRTVNINKKSDKKYYIDFEGVASCFYLWINGVFKGYSQVSHCTSEFDITNLLKNGENLFQVLVVKHCTGSYLEDQDFFRLSGIFRDVFILERDIDHIKDIFIKPIVSDDFKSAQIRVTPDYDGKISWKLVSPDKSEVLSGENSGEFTIPVKNAVLWNTEAPALYTLFISAGQEHIAFPVGLKRAEIKNSVFLFNGKKIKIKGINRHDFTPETGYYVSPDEMLKDLYCLKRANVNAIRTSHYPNDPRFSELCDRLGFMLIDEADLESHGMGYNYGDWYWDYWAYLCNSPDWADSCADRAKRLFERDKNRACVIMWSLGNESGCGENHRIMAQYIRSRDNTAIIHYENAHLEYAKRLNKDFSDISDVESRMYAPLDYLKNYLEDKELKKPFFYCEYVSAWSTGDIPLHWGEFEEYDKYMGGCIWEFKDHAVNIGTKKAPAYRYGGDFGDKPNDGIYCVDGLVHPDRTPRPGFAEMKQTYKPFDAKYENGIISIKNKRFFTDLSDLSAKITVEKDGIKIIEQNIDSLKIAPGEKLEIPFTVPDENGNITLNIFVCQNSDTLWEKCGYELGFCQFTLKKALKNELFLTENCLKTQENRTKISVKSGDTEYIFSKITGMPVSIENGFSLLEDQTGLSIFRAYLPNCSKHSEWERARYNDAKTKCYSCVLTENTPEKAVIKANCSIAAAAMPPAVRAEITYTVQKSGKLTVYVKTAVTGRAPALPRFGFVFTLPKGFENIEYLGLGERETYCDRHSCERFSLYKTTADSDFEHYVRPTECSAHYGTVFAKLSNENDKGLLFAAKDEKGFSFSARHFTDKMLMDTLHDDELKRDDKLFVHIDYKVHPENGGNTDICPERCFDEKAFSFEFDVIPF